MPTDLPPLICLQAFEAVARLGSVTRAAAELGVTQPAISQRLRRLEALLERPLIRRTGGGAAVTSEAEGYAARLQGCFAELRVATDAMRATADRQVITLSLLGTLAQRWLIPRLPRFQDARPEIEIRLLTTSRMVDLARDDVDLSIRAGRGRWPGCRADFLIANECFRWPARACSSISRSTPRPISPAMS